MSLPIGVETAEALRGLCDQLRSEVAEIEAGEMPAEFIVPHVRQCAELIDMLAFHTIVRLRREATMMTRQDTPGG